MTIQGLFTAREKGRCPVPAVAALIAACCVLPTAARADATPATVLATFIPGQSWTWTLSGQLTQIGGQVVPLSGSMFEDVEVLPFQGGSTLAFVSTQTLTAGGAPLFGQVSPAAIFYFQQDPATHTVYVVGDNQGPDSAVRIPLQPVEFVPGQWSLNTSYDTALSFASGETEPLFLNVTGTTTITTPLGTFAAWVAPNGATDPSGISHPGTDYWTPELGVPAAFETSTVFPDGSAIQIAATLTEASILGATSVPEPGSIALLGCGLLGLAAERAAAAWRSLPQLRLHRRSSAYSPGSAGRYWARRAASRAT